jgi:hypothetical protein
MAVTRTYVGTATSTTLGTTQTFTSQGVGTADAARSTVVTVNYTQQGTNTTPPTMTIGGSAATADVTQFSGIDGASNRCFTGIYRRANPTGTTATIVLSLSQASFDCVIGVYSLLNIGSVTDTTVVGGTTIGTPFLLTVSTDTVVDGAVIAVSESYDTVSAGIWVGVTADGSAHLYSGDYRQWASADGTVAATPRTVTLDYSAEVTVHAISVVSYAPTAAAAGTAKQMHHRQQMAAA